MQVDQARDRVRKKARAPESVDLFYQVQSRETKTVLRRDGQPVGQPDARRRELGIRFELPIDPFDGFKTQLFSGLDGLHAPFQFTLFLIAFACERARRVAVAHAVV